MSRYNLLILIAVIFTQVPKVEISVENSNIVKTMIRYLFAVEDIPVSQEILKKLRFIGKKHLMVIMNQYIEIKMVFGL